MSLFSQFFSTNSSSEKPNFPWISLEDLGTLHDLSSQSSARPVFIFKHSTRCSISRFAIKQFENDAKDQSELYSFYYLDLITFRDAGTNF
jgi:bacillithiol system protein YtxJ